MRQKKTNNTKLIDLWTSVKEIGQRDMDNKRTTEEQTNMNYGMINNGTDDE